MSTKAEITALVLSKLTGNVGKTSRAQHEDYVYNTPGNMVDTLYGLVSSDTNATTVIVTENNANKTYILNTIKQGGKTEMKAIIRNATGTITAANEVWFSITTTEYEQQTGLPVPVFGLSTLTGETIRLVLTGDVLASIDPIGLNETVDVIFTYNNNA